MSEMILLVELWAPSFECRICDRPCAAQGGCGIPMYEDHVLPNVWPLKPGDWPGEEWGGFPACERCFEVQGSLVAPIDERAFRSLAAAWNYCAHDAAPRVRHGPHGATS